MFAQRGLLLGPATSKERLRVLSNAFQVSIVVTVGGVSWVGHGEGDEPGSCMNVPTKIEK